MSDAEPLENRPTPRRRPPRDAVTLRILHTSDWHLGQTLHETSREAEHRLFLAWLLDRIEEHRVDALLVAGDVFDGPNPPASAQQILYDFLADLRRRMPETDIVMTAGNHDSAQRLEAPSGLLGAFGVHVVGSLATAGAGLIAPLSGEAGRVDVREGTDASAPDTSPRNPSEPRPAPAAPLQADPPSAFSGGDAAPGASSAGRGCRAIVRLRRGGAVAAIPFLRPVDLPPRRQDDAQCADQVEAVRSVYERARTACAAIASGGPSIALGHLWLAGGAATLDSERLVLLGGEAAIPREVFDSAWSYVALGHLHRAQTVGMPTVRYSGSPIPLALSEASYRHQVVLVEFEGDRAAEVRPLEVPRAAAIVRLPESGEMTPDEALAALDLLERRGNREEGDPLRPRLSVHVRLDRPDPTLRTRVETALRGAWPRLCRLQTVLPGGGGALGDAAAGRDLRELAPEDVFAHLWRREHGENAIPEELVEAFRILVHEAAGEGAP